MAKFVALILFVIALWAGPVQAQDPVATLKSVSGQVLLQRGDATTPASAGADLYIGDVLRTEANSSAGISFVDGTRISLGPSSEIQMTKYHFEPLNKDYSFDMYMKKGSAVYTSGKLGKLAPEAVKFNTPQATVGVRGTRFLVSVN